MKTFGLSTILAAVALAGCTPTASVTYNIVNGPDVTGSNRFAFQSTIINITQASNGGSAVQGQYTFTAVPANDPSGNIYSVADASGLGVTTQVTLTHRTNTDLISSIGTTVQDNRGHHDP